MSVARSLPRSAGGVVAVTVALAGAVALLVRAFGADADARELLAFRFDPPGRRPGEALDVAATNLRFVVAALLAARAVTSRPRLRLPFDITLTLVLAINAAAVGITLGAYGTRTLRAIAAHWPLELAAFALAGGAYLSARRGTLATRHLVELAVLALAVVALGAVLETYVQIGDAP